MIITFKQVILFPAYLKEPLEDYLKKLQRVRLVRTTKREGLVRARLLGASQAKGTTLFAWRRTPV